MYLNSVGTSLDLMPASWQCIHLKDVTIVSISSQQARLAWLVLYLDTCVLVIVCFKKTCIHADIENDINLVSQPQF